jgi:hypothetical protein
VTITWGENQPPVAHAGTDRLLSGASPAGAEVMLDGRGSADPDGNVLTYRWTGPFPEGGGIVFGATPTVTMPLGVSTVTLVVSDGQLDSEPAAVNITVSDFALAVSGAASATVKAGQSASYTLALSSKHGAFSNPVALACADLPAGLSCAFSAASVVPGDNGATVTLTVTTSATLAHGGSRTVPLLAGFLGLPLMGIVVLSAARRRRRWMLLGALALAATLQAACGGGQLAPPPPSASQTQPRTFAITVTATSGVLVHATEVTVTTTPN